MNYELNQCFFGEHLLAQNRDAVIVVFESEKTAVLASTLFTDMICIASSGLNGLNPNKCKALSNRHVIFIPDLGCSEEWQIKVKKICQVVPFASVQVYTQLEGLATKEDREAGLDFGDYLIRELITNKKSKSLVMREALLWFDEFYDYYYGEIIK